MAARAGPPLPGVGRRIVAAVTVGVIAVACSGSLPDLPAAVPERGVFSGTELGGDDDSNLLGRVHEDALIACMTAAGFEYINETSEAGLGFDPPAWGISTGYGHELGQPAIEAPAPSGSNAAIVEALSPEERAAYYLALWGADEGQANELVGPNQAARALAQEEIGLAYNEIEDRINADPRLTEVRQSWQQCMGEVGIEVAAPYEASALISQRMAALVEQGLVPDRSTLPVDPASATYAANAELGHELRALQEEKIGLYEAVQRCDQQVGLSDMEARVRHAYEVPFAEEYAEQIEILRIPDNLSPP